MCIRLADQQISPSYNGHRVTIKVNRSNEAISSNHSSKVRMFSFRQDLYLNVK